MPPRSDKEIRLGLTVDTKSGEVSVRNLSGEFDKLKNKGNESLDDIGNKSENAGSKFKAMGVKAGVALGAIAAGVYAAKKAFDAASIGSKLHQEKQSFHNLAESYGADSTSILADMKKLSAGTVDTATIINKSGTAMLMGIHPEKLADLMAIARSTARMTGQDVSKAFEDITLASARGSKMILDNLGIILDIDKANKDYAESLGIVGRELNDVERKEAFLQATISAGKDLMLRIGGGADTAAEKFQAFGSAVTDLKDGISKLIASALTPLIAPLTSAVTALNELIDPKKSTLKDMTAQLEDMRAKLLPLTTQQQGFLSATLAGMKVDQKAAKAINEKTFALMSTIRVMEEAIKTEDSRINSVKKVAEAVAAEKQAIENEKEAVLEAARIKEITDKLAVTRTEELTKLNEANSLARVQLMGESIEQERALIDHHFNYKSQKVRDEMGLIEEGSIFATSLQKAKLEELTILEQQYATDSEDIEAEHIEAIQEMKNEARELGIEQDAKTTEGKLEALAQFHEMEMEALTAQQDAITEKDDYSLAQLELLKAKKLSIEEKYEKNVQKVKENADKADKQRMSLQLKGAANLAGGLADIAKMMAESSGSHAKEMFAMYKAFAFSEAVIAGEDAAVKAWDFGMKTGPWTAAAYTAASLIKTGMQIANIQGQSVSGYAHGGVVSQPTMFNDGKGPAVVGEVPGQSEGILPLANVGGNLGVSATGMGGTVNNFNINAVDAQSFVDLCRKNPEIFSALISEAYDNGDAGLVNATADAIL